MNSEIILTTEEFNLYNALSRQVIGAAIEVHRELGAGLLESAYEFCLKAELERQGLCVETQVDMPLFYKGEPTGKFYRNLLPIHEVQLVTYLKLTNKAIGLLINFNVPVLKDGIKRKINARTEYTGIKPIRE